MRAAERWDIYQARMHDARFFHSIGQEQNCWHELLLAAEVNWTPEPSRKQVQQRKLWTELGALHRTRANLRLVIRNYKDTLLFSIELQALRQSEETCTTLILLINQQMRQL